MTEFRIIIHNKNEILEQKIVQHLEPHCSRVVVVEEEGNAGLTISIISLVMTVPGFTVAVKDILDWIDEARKSSAYKHETIDFDKHESEGMYRYEIECDGKKYDLCDAESKEERDEMIDFLVVGI